MSSASDPHIVTPGRKALQPARRPETHCPAHHKAQVEPGQVNQEPFQNVCVTTKVCATHPAGVVAVGEAALRQFSTLGTQTLSATTANAPAVGIHRVTLGTLAQPVTTAAVRLGNIGANVLLALFFQNRIAVVALVGYHLRKD